MIITESFVWLNNPKTASTFIRKTLSELYNRRGKSLVALWRLRNRWMVELEVPELRPKAGLRAGKLTPHGTINQIPEKYVYLPVVSAIRDPVEKYLSLYSYADWKKTDQLPVALDVINKKYPNFPELSFEAFVDYTNDFYGNNRLVIGASVFNLGPMAADFLRFFCYSYDSNESAFYFQTWEALCSQLAKVIFFHSRTINLELYNFLLDLHFDSSDVDFLLSKSPENVSDKIKLTSVNNSLRDCIRKREWLLTSATQSLSPIDWKLAETAAPTAELLIRPI
jgi:hypothetical protein